MDLPQLKDEVFQLSDAENRVPKPSTPTDSPDGTCRGWLWEYFEELFEVPYL